MKITDKFLNQGGRDEQQDACAIFKNLDSILLVLGDGMGGHSGGKVASESLISEAKYVYSKQKGIIKNPKKLFQEIVNGTVLALKEYRRENNNSDPHTTCVLALIQNNRVYIGHIGDSRAYLFIDKEFVVRSRDHSVVQMLLNEGEITEEEMATHPDQNRLLRSISSRKEVKITFKEYKLPLNKSNAILLCSDGLWEQISIEEMQKQLFNKPLNSALRDMVMVAKKRGGKDGDNISVVSFVKKVSFSSLLNNSDYILSIKKILISIIAILAIIVGILYYIKYV
jgi:serine/threonine protein phosphatase PrpC